MKEKDKLIRAYSGTGTLVHILKDKLAQDGISSTIHNDSGDSFLNVTPAVIDLYIQQSDLNKAQPIIQDFMRKN
jgi:hypothetical protein